MSALNGVKEEPCTCRSTCLRFFRIFNANRSNASGVYPCVYFFPASHLRIGSYHKEKVAVSFIGSFALIMLHGYYFAYMVTILAFVFGIIRYLDVYGKICWKEFRTIFFRAAAGYILAALMGLITLLPAVLLYLSSTRGNSGGEYPFLIFSLEYYKNLFTGMFFPPGDTDYPALVSVVLPFILIPFIERKRDDKY